MGEEFAAKGRREDQRPVPGPPLTERLTELVRRRDLLLNLTHAELTARYKSTALGLAWSVVNPLLSLLILTIVFQHVVRLDIPNYPVFLLSALLPWTFFQTGLTSATTSVTRSPALIKRVRIPRVFLPIASILASLVHFVTSLLLLFVLMAVVGTSFWPHLLLLPALAILQVVCLVGLALATCSLNVFYRDVEYAVNATLRVLFYLTPTFYPLAYVPARWLDLYLLNPMAGIVEIYRQTLVQGTLPSPRVLTMGVATSLAALAVGVVIFWRLEPHFDDYL